MVVLPAVLEVHCVPDFGVGLREEVGGEHGSGAKAPMLLTLLALEAEAQHVIAVHGRRLAQADPAALAEQRFLTPQHHLAAAAVDQDKGTVRGLVGDHEVAVAPEDARVHARGAGAGDDHVVALVAAERSEPARPALNMPPASADFRVPLLPAAPPPRPGSRG